MSLDNQLDVNGSELNHSFKLEINSNLQENNTMSRAAQSGGERAN